MKGHSVTTSFALPPGAPAEVVAAHEEFGRVADRWAELRGDLEEAEAAVKTAEQADTEAAAAAFAKGDAVEDAAALERDALVKVRALAGMLQGAELAVDQAGNAMLAPIEEARESWTAQLEAERDEAAALYEAAIFSAQSALAKLGRTTSALTWLRDFDAGAAKVGQFRGYHGKSAGLVAEDKVGHTADPRQLLELAATATARLSLDEQRAARQAEADAESAARRAARQAEAVRA